LKVALVSCSKKKKGYACKAKEIYSESTLFNKTASYVARKYFSWFIISAKYGLLNPEEVIEPYDVTLYNMSKDEIIDWSKKVADSLVCLGIDKVDIYAGSLYRKYLIRFLDENNIKYNVPMQGLGIGKQLQFLSRCE
jgi:hypothetical protein